MIRGYLGRIPILAAFGTLYLRGSGGMPSPPWKMLKMHTLGDAFSSILWAFRTYSYQVTGTKVMMNWGV